jgi:hypothetical protein
MELVRFNSSITKSIDYISNIERNIIWTSYVTNSIIKRSLIQKIKYIISKVF